MRSARPAAVTLLSLLLLLATGAHAAAQPSPDALERHVDSLMAAYDSAGTPGGVVGVIRGGRVVFAEGYGMASLAHGIPNTPETRFNIGSVSKQFLAFAFAMLADRGELSLDDPVADHLEDWPTFRDTVRLRHLLTHTSGYREAYGTLALAGKPAGENYLPREEALEVVRRQPELEFPAGSEYQYNSTAFVILAEILERVTGEPATAWVEANVLGPLGMGETDIETAVGDVIPHAADSYTKGEDGEHLRLVSNRAIFGAAEVFTTVGDLAKWLRNFHTAEVGGRAVQEALRERFVLTSGDTTDYALGLRVDEHRGLRRLQHSGGHAGYRAQLSYYPELDAGVVVMSNYDDVNSGEVADRVAELAFGDRMEAAPPGPRVLSDDVEPVAVDPARLAAYAGTYRSEEDDLLTFEARDDTLIGEGQFRLVPIADTLFRVQGVPVGVSFHAREDDRATRATVILSDERTVYHRIDSWHPSAAELSRFAGRYESPELETHYVVAVADAQLVARHRWLGRMPLDPLWEDAFEAEDGPRLEFERNQMGLVTGFYASVGRTRDVWFQRRE